MTTIVQIIFGFIGIIFLLLCVLLLRTRNGLKIEFLAFFIALAWASIVRTVEPALPEAVPTDLVSLMVGLPILFTGGYLVIYLFRQYRGTE